MTAGDPPAFVLDEHVPVALAGALRERDVDAVHVLEQEMGGVPDPALLRSSQKHERILVTRNYRDFAPLVEILQRRGDPFPGVLFVSPAVPPAGLAAHLRAVEEWLRRRARGEADVRSTFGWLR